MRIRTRLSAVAVVVALASGGCHTKAPYVAAIGIGAVAIAAGASEDGKCDGGDQWLCFEFSTPLYAMGGLLASAGIIGLLALSTDGERAAAPPPPDSLAWPGPGPAPTLAPPGPPPLSPDATAVQLAAEAKLAADRGDCAAARALLAQAMLRDPDNFDRIVPDGAITCR